jgi:two-component system chemotaxis response regulator CheY
MEINMISQTILLADDSRISRMLVRDIIERADIEIEIIEASNAKDALSKVADRQINIAILDLNMPGMDGLMLATELLARFPILKIGLLTANVQDIVREKAKALGVTFIAKPITEQKILTFISAI